MSLIDRLRDTGCDREPFTPSHSGCRCRLANEAADEIEHLRAGVEFAMNWIDGTPSKPSTDDKRSARRVLYEALHGKPGKQERYPPSIQCQVPNFKGKYRQTNKQGHAQATVLALGACKC
jgi:hypothetical protein